MPATRPHRPFPAAARPPSSKGGSPRRTHAIYEGVTARDEVRAVGGETRVIPRGAGTVRVAAGDDMEVAGGARRVAGADETRGRTPAAAGNRRVVAAGETVVAAGERPAEWEEWGVAPGHKSQVL